MNKQQFDETLAAIKQANRRVKTEPGYARKMLVETKIYTNDGRLTKLYGGDAEPEEFRYTAEEFKALLDFYKADILAAIARAETKEELDQIRVDTVGRNGEITQALKSLWKKQP